MTENHNEKPGERNGNAKPGGKRNKVTLRQVTKEYLSNLPNGGLFTSNRLNELLKKHGVEHE